MAAEKSVPLWLHLIRLAVLVAAAAGLAWVVASAQRRANYARVERQSALGLTGGVTQTPEEPLSAEGLTLEEIQAEIARYDHPSIELSSLEIGTPDSSQPPRPFQFKVKFLPRAHTNRFFSSTKAAVLEPVVRESSPQSQYLELSPAWPPPDPYMSSSKSLVIEPLGSEESQPVQRHGKP